MVLPKYKFIYQGIRCCHKSEEMRVLKNKEEEFLLKKMNLYNVKFKLSDKVFIKLGDSNACVIPHEISSSDVFNNKNDLFKISLFKLNKGFVLLVNKVEEYEQ